MVLNNCEEIKEVITDINVNNIISHYCPYCGHEVFNSLDNRISPRYNDSLCNYCSKIINGY